MSEGQTSHWEGGDVANILFDVSYSCDKQDSACQSACLPNSMFADRARGQK